YWCCDLSDIHSFPTRRSSDLTVTREAESTNSPAASRGREWVSAGSPATSFVPLDLGAGFLALRLAVFMDKKEPPSGFRPLVEIPAGHARPLSGIPDHDLKLRAGFGEFRGDIGQSDSLPEGGRHGARGHRADIGFAGADDAPFPGNGQFEQFQPHQPARHASRSGF